MDAQKINRDMAELAKKLKYSIGRFLCLIGLHSWKYGSTEVKSVGFKILFRTRECEKCGLNQHRTSLPLFNGEDCFNRWV